MTKGLTNQTLSHVIRTAGAIPFTQRGFSTVLRLDPGDEFRLEPKQEPLDSFYVLKSYAEPY